MTPAAALRMLARLLPEGKQRLWWEYLAARGAVSGQTDEFLAEARAALTAAREHIEDAWRMRDVSSLRSAAGWCRNAAVCCMAALVSAAADR